MIALRSEIDEWLKSCPSSVRMSSQNHIAPMPGPLPQVTRLLTLILEGRELLEKTRRSRVELNTALVELKSNVKSMSSRMRPLREAQTAPPANLIFA